MTIWIHISGKLCEILFIGTTFWVKFCYLLRWKDRCNLPLEVSGNIAIEMFYETLITCLTAEAERLIPPMILLSVDSWSISDTVIRWTHHMQISNAKPVELLFRP